MGRRVFISYEGHDRQRAKGFNLLRWNEGLKLDFVGRHLLDPVDSRDAAYVSRQIREQISGTSVTVVLIGRETATSKWVAKEVEWSLAKDTPNGILGIRLEADAPIPDSLLECGAEIIDWKPSRFEDAIQRAAKAAGRAALIRRMATIAPGCVRSA
jgi:hypothetical protein